MKNKVSKTSGAIQSNRIEFLNTFVDNVTMEQALDNCFRMIEAGGFHYVVTPNVDHIVLIDNDLQFSKIYEEADLILTDGKPLIWISKLLKKPIVEKVSGSDFFPKLCGLAAKKGWKIFLLGAEEGVGEKAANNLVVKYQGLQIAGTYSPPFGFEKDAAELQRIVSLISSSNAQILGVGLGAPKQERFIYNNKDKLEVNLALGIGATIDFEAGVVKRAPAWVSKAGVEWLYRLIREPKRMFKRYVIRDSKILAIYLRYKYSNTSKGRE